MLGKVSTTAKPPCSDRRASDTFYDHFSFLIRYLGKNADNTTAEVIRILENAKITRICFDRARNALGALRQGSQQPFSTPYCFDFV